MPKYEPDKKEEESGILGDLGDLGEEKTEEVKEPFDSAQGKEVPVVAPPADEPIAIQDGVDYQ